MLFACSGAELQAMKLHEVPCLAKGAVGGWHAPGTQSFLATCMKVGVCKLLAAPAWLSPIYPGNAAAAAGVTLMSAVPGHLKIFEQQQSLLSPNQLLFPPHMQPIQAVGSLGM